LILSFYLALSATSVVKTSAFTYKDVTLSGSNKLEYWLWDPSESDQELFDNRFDLDLFYSDFHTGLRLWVLEPSEVTAEERMEGFSRRFFEYTKEHFNIRAGNYYAIFGRGLTLRSYEDDLLNLDQDLDGLKVGATFEEGDLTVLSGQPRNILFDQHRYKITNDTMDVIRGIDLTLRPQSIFSWGKGTFFYTLGANYVRFNRKDIVLPDTSRMTELFGGNLNLNIGNVDFYGEYAKKTGWDVIGFREIEDNADLGRNSGLLLSLNYSIPGVGVTAQFADYDSIGVGSEGLFGNRYNAPPPLNRFGLPINKGTDEKGYEIDLLLSPIDFLNFELSSSRMTSRDTVTDGKLVGEKKKIAEIFGEGRWEFFGEYIITLSFDRLEQIGIFDDFPEKIEYTPYIETSYYLHPEHVVGFTYQNKIFRGSEINAEPLEYEERLLSLFYSFANEFTLTLSGEKRTKEIKESPETEWLLGELIWEVSQNHNLTVRVGSEKGGIVCSGGVCRLEPNFDGVKLTLLSRF
jgi:hypothetical protein